MPLKRGPLHQWQKSKIQKNYIYIKENLDAKDIQDYFITAEIFDIPDLERINGFNPNTRESRNNCFLQLLFDSSADAYEVFLNALRESGNGYVADKIDSTEVTQAATNSSDDLSSWLSSVPSSIRNKRLKERELSKLAQTLGSDWELVMLDMGLAQTDIDHAKMDQVTATMKIYTCLNKWKNRSADMATFEKFIKIVESCQATTINWEQIKKVVHEYTMEQR